MIGAPTSRPPAAIPGLIDPEDGAPLQPDTPHSLAGAGSHRWPVVEGIPYLRVGRESFRRRALDALDAGDVRGALVALLADQDDYARIPPPPPGAIAAVVDAVDDGSATLRDAMAGLNFGPVADYFAHRWSAPTFLSGLALLDRHAPAAAPVVEVACGIGHFLRELSMRGVPAVGVDVVFAKLWLARRFVVPPSVALICGDALGLPLDRPGRPRVVVCHDAFYFLPDKPRVIGAFRRVAGPSGAILIGHAHNSRFDHRGVAGEPRTPEEYADLLPGGALYDDADLARAGWSGSEVVPKSASELAGVEAVALAWPSDPAGGLGLGSPRPDALLRLNPLLVDDGGSLGPRWPSPGFEAEYADASPYLRGEARPRFELPVRVPEDGRVDPEVARLSRRRILLDLPERW